MNPLQLLQQNSGVDPDGKFGKKTLLAAQKYLKITTPQRAAHFFAQTYHESGGFTRFSENLNYTTKELLTKVFKYDFDLNKDKIISPSELAFAQKYVGNKEKTANFVYANQNGNGNESSGDGWKYRGRGAIQLTGKANYQYFSTYIKDPEVMTNPDIVATKYAFESAMFYFNRFGVWEWCDKGFSDATITKISKIINGGIVGLDKRIEETHKFASFI